MTTTEELLTEFEREAATTRKHLERLPDDKLTWKPHEKSFTAGGLASHLVECIRWADSILNHNETDVNPAEYKSYNATSQADLLRTFDDEVAKCKQALKSISDSQLSDPWRLKLMGKTRFEKPKWIVFRDFTLSHLIHHRGQFSVYLRLLDLPVPGSYGPSADEMANFK